MAHTKVTRSIFSLIAALMAVFLMASPALAHHKADHEQGTQAASDDSSATAASDSDKPAKDNDGDADSDSSSTVTEDTDKNDGGTPNNVPDENDNAHPSGKDRSVESGNSTSNPNQGKAESDPDDDGRGPDRTNGGPDKPGGSGGTDLADQDGNNGCGNDDDFEDDNEGRCGPGAKPVKPCPSGTTMVNGTCVKTPPVKDCPNGTMVNGTCVKGGEVKNCPNGSTMVNGTCVKGDEVKNDKITICHATGSSSNPYVTITISVNGLNGHGDHEGDIIPMPAGGCPAVQGEVIVNNPCPFDATMAANDPNCGPVAPPAPVEVDEDDAEPIVKGETTGPDVDNSSIGPAAAERGPSKVAVLGAVLPFTGASLLAFLAASLGFIAAGFAALKLRKN